MEVVVDGTLARAADGSGLLPFVRGPNGRIVEQARLFDAANLQRMVSAAALWQVASVIVAQKHLADISGRLKAFGYIMLAETIKFGNEAGGLGNIINTSIRRGLRENVFLVLLLIPLVALAIDQVLFWLQRQLFPHVYGGQGWLHRGFRRLMHAVEDLRHTLFPRRARA